MMDIDKITERRNRIFEQIMENASFMAVYNVELYDNEEEEELLKMMEKLDDAIYAFNRGDSAQSMKFKDLERLVEEIEEKVNL